MLCIGKTPVTLSSVQSLQKRSLSVSGRAPGFAGSEGARFLPDAGLSARQTAVRQLRRLRDNAAEQGHADARNYCLLMGLDHLRFAAGLWLAEEGSPG
jgi:hypothetical protein